MSGSFRAAAIQMVSEPSVAANLAVAAALIDAAAAGGAKLIALPEYFCFMGLRDTDKLAVREADGSGPVQDFLSCTAARHGVWIIGGTVPLECADAGRVRNSCLVYDATGQRVARYDKIHLFGLALAEERFHEADTIEAGECAEVLDTPFGSIALSVCYDLRFPELYRSNGPVDLITVPSAFTATTGKAHWEPLLRARAIENLAWVIAPAQGGKHANGRRTHGHSMIVNPWGEIVASQAEGPGVVFFDIDPAFTAKVRASLPALEHRVLA